jgi:hypothetical protein
MTRNRKECPFKITITDKNEVRVDLSRSRTSKTVQKVTRIGKISRGFDHFMERTTTTCTTSSNTQKFVNLAPATHLYRGLPLVVWKKTNSVKYFVLVSQILPNLYSTI